MLKKSKYSLDNAQVVIAIFLDTSLTIIITNKHLTSTGKDISNISRKMFDSFEFQTDL